MLPVIALVGRPNVGKSTLFNSLTKSRQALVADYAGLTRDRIYGQAHIADKPSIVIDTGGIERTLASDNPLTHQTRLALEEADVILFMLDAKAGLLPADMALAQHLRKLAKPVLCVVNKIDGLDAASLTSEFYQLGLPDLIPMAAIQNRGVHQLAQKLASLLPKSVDDLPTEPVADRLGIRIAIVGRPNVGKSTLVNCMLGEDRVVVLDLPGTTRDSVYIPCRYQNDDFTLIDTAGVRRGKHIRSAIEKFSIVKTLQAVDDANVVIYVLDATEKITEQDLRLLGFVLESGRALVIAVNKWDGLSAEQRSFMRKELDRRLQFVRYATYHFISALHGSGVGDLFTLVKEAYLSATKPVSTPQINALLQKAVTQHPPPLSKGHRIKLRYAHIGGYNPPIIVIHGSQTHALPGSYRRYLENFFRQKLKLNGTPIRLHCHNSDNPFAK